MSRPSAAPTTVAARPIRNASSTTERSTWRRDAPIVRSSANSRVRCATVIENVLKMMNAPTKSAIPAKASRKTLMNVTKPFRPAKSNGSASFAVCTFVDVACERGSRRLRARVRGVDARRAASEIMSTCPRLSNSVWAVFRSKRRRSPCRASRRSRT